MQCKKCSNKFVITAEDEAFYAKLSIPSPVLCPDCRRQRRFAFRNERALYSRSCDLCKKPTVSFYSPTYPGPVYCQPCWWSDNWDPFAYGIEYDSSRSFFDQLKELFLKVPQLSIIKITSENSEFTAHSSNNKNCYLVISSLGNEDSYYCFQITECKDVVDSVFARNVNLGYELVDCEQMYNSSYCQKSNNCMDSRFLYDCHGCNNCFMSVNLRNKEYCFKNEQLSRDEYEKRMSEIHSGSFSEIEKLKKEFARYIASEAVNKFATQTKCEDSSGDYLLNCVNAKECFDARNLENCKYIVVSPGPTKDSYDLNYFGLGAERVCDSLSNIGSVMDQQYCQYSWGSSYIQYCSYVMNSDNCFGSVGMKKAKFCILNTQYSQEEYEKLRSQIIQDMKTRGEYGQFFPSALSAFGYNETIANDERPLTKEEAGVEGFNWCDDVAGKFGAPTKEWITIPDDIAQIDESILREVLACIDCGKNFKIINQELEFYKKMTMPLPRRCFDCRHMARMHMRNPRHLWARQCMCDRAGHDHVAQCSNTFETTYAPDRPELVYCELCYKREIV